MEVSIYTVDGHHIYRIYSVNEKANEYESLQCCVKDEKIIDYLFLVMDKNMKVKHVEHSEGFLDSLLYRELGNVPGPATKVVH